TELSTLSLHDALPICNAGHFDVEINKNDLQELATSIRRVRDNTDEYLMPDGRKLYLLAEGRLVNLAAGDGHPAEVMDLSFSLQRSEEHTSELQSRENL